MMNNDKIQNQFNLKSDFNSNSTLKNCENLNQCDSKIDDSIKEKLFSVAVDMMNFSYVPYSHFTVGAALLTKSGKIIGGCNIENAAYSPTNCAERTAFFKAISEGIFDFTAIMIVGGPNKVLKDYCAPCGVCRQVMMEFCEPENFSIFLAKSKDDIIEYKLKDLLPLGFGAEDLKK